MSVIFKNGYIFKIRSRNRWGYWILFINDNILLFSSLKITCLLESEKLLENVEVFPIVGESWIIPGIG